MIRSKSLSFKIPEFPEYFKDNRLWVITWIGKAHSVDGSYKVVIWFYPYEMFKSVLSESQDFNPQFFKSIKVDHECLDQFVVGCVWNNKGKMIKQVIHNDLFRNHRETLTFKKEQKPVYLKDIILDKAHKNLPFDNEKLKNTPVVVAEINKHKYIIPSSEIARYFFFISSQVIRLFFNIQSKYNNVRLLKDPFKDEGSDLRKIEVQYGKYYNPNEQIILAKYVASSSYRSAANYIASSLSYFTPNSTDLSRYYKCNMPVNKELKIRVAYYPVEIEGKSYRFVVQILDHIDDNLFDVITPIIATRNREQNPDTDHGGSVRLTKYDLDRCALEADIEVAPDYNSISLDVDAGVSGERFFENRTEPDIGSPEYLEEQAGIVAPAKSIIINSALAESVSTNKYGNQMSDAGRANLNRKDKGNGYYQEFYELFLETMDELKYKSGCDVIYAKYSKDKKLFFQEKQTMIMGKPLKHIVARLEHPTFKGVHYFIESGIEGKTENHMTAMLSLTNISELGDYISDSEIKLVHQIIQIAEKSNALWTKVEKSGILNNLPIKQKNLDHQKGKEASHFVKKIERYLKTFFPMIESIQTP